MAIATKKCHYSNTPKFIYKYDLIFTLDSSNVYGSTQSEMRKLRSFKNGLLKTSTASDGGELLPQNRNADCIGGSTTKCFLAGDSRVNEQPNLAVMHTLFLREHNRIGNLILCIHTRSMSYKKRLIRNDSGH